MSSVYSTRLLLGLASSGIQTFVVPDGKVCVVRDVDAVLYVPGPGIGLLTLFVAGAAVWGINRGHSDTTPDNYQWRGRQVLAAGELLQVEVDFAEADYAVSGYLLSSP